MSDDEKAILLIKKLAEAHSIVNSKLIGSAQCRQAVSDTIKEASDALRDYDRGLKLALSANNAYHGWIEFYKLKSEKAAK